VTLTPRYLNILKALYPPPIQFSVPTHSHNTRKKTTVDTPRPNISKDSLIKTLRHLKRGTATGPFATSIDLYKDYALFSIQHDTQTSFPYLDTFHELVTLITHNNIPANVKQYFAAQYVVALHKDPNALDKIRPIGIGTALRRITAATLMTQYGSDIADILTPHGQLGIAISGGLDFICHSTQAQLSTFMPDPQHSSRALLTLDITNMFNAISRQACRYQLSKFSTIHSLLPFFDLLYATPNTCWHKSPDSHHANFPQWEGFAQGCPLSGAFSDLVLSMVLQPINHELQQRHFQSIIPPPATLSYHDDTSIVLPYTDIPWFLTRFQELGNPLGIQLNLQKTQILTTLTEESPLPYLHPSQQQALLDTLQILGSNAEQRHGIRLLGQPIGSAYYAETYLNQKIDQIHNLTSQKLFYRLNDHQTQTALIKHCIIPSIQHLLATHVYHTFNTESHDDLHQWHTDSTIQLRMIIHNTFAKLTNQMTLPPHAIPIIHLPATLGGIGIRDPIATAVPSALTTFSRSLRYAHFGISNTRPIAKIHQYSFQFSKHQKILDHFSTNLLSKLPETPTTPKTIQDFIQHAQLKGVQQQLYLKHQQSVRKLLYDTTPADIADLLPSLLSPLTSIPLLSLTRRITTNRISNPLFRILLQRKLRLPMLPPSLQHKPCICRSKAILDPYGDHFFSCTAISKTPIHNRLRDTCFHILTKLAPLANLTTAPTDVQLEPPNIIPSFPTLRPADIGLQLIPKPNMNADPDSNPFLALDITFTHIPNIQSLNASSSDRPEKITNTSKVHDDSARQKFNVPHAFAILSHNLILLPMTFDHLGGIGPFATDFLFGAKQKSLVTTAAPLPTWSPLSFPQNPDAYLLYQRTLSHTPKNILSQADFHWQAGSHQHRTYGKTYHSSTPSAWATQTLGLNLTQGLAQHCHNAIEKLIHHCQTQRTTYRRSQQHSNVYSPFFLQRSPVADPYLCFTSPTPSLSPATGNTTTATNE
jgi:hypothetical protein